MKRLSYILCFWLVMLSCPFVDGANQLGMDKHGLRTNSMGYAHNLYGFYIDAGYSSILHTIPNTSSNPGGYEVGAGFCYEHQRGVTKFQVGLGLRYQDLTFKVNDTTFSKPNMRDFMGMEYTLYYDFFDRVDRSVTWQLQLPLLVGLDVRHFYCLGGFKLNLNISGQTYIRAIGTTTGEYEQFGIMSEMDNHGFRKNVSVESKDAKVIFKPDVQFSLEAGYEWSNNLPKQSQSPSRKPGLLGEYRVRLAAFGEIGLVNICRRTDLPLIDIPADYPFDFSEYTLNHIFTTDVAQSRSLHNFNVGIKLTMLFGTYKNKRCVICSEWNFNRSK